MQQKILSLFQNGELLTEGEIAKRLGIENSGIIKLKLNLYALIRDGDLTVINKSYTTKC